MKNQALIKLRDRFCCNDLEKIDNVFSVNVGDICKKLGMKAAHVRMSDNISGRIWSELGIYHIEANDNHHPNRRRFTVAHELGHYLLHKDVLDEKGEILERSDKVYDEKELQMEKEANEFAAELLMPESYFREKYKEYKEEEDKMLGYRNAEIYKDSFYYKLSRYFFVSQKAIEIRLVNLGLMHGY